MQRLTAAEKKRIAEFKKRRNESFEQIVLENKAAGFDPHESKEIQLTKEKVVDSVGKLSEKQNKVEKARKIISRDKRIKDARQKRTEQLVHEIAFQTGEDIDKNVARSVLENSKRIISDPAFDEYVGRVVKQKTTDKLNFLATATTAETDSLQLQNWVRKEE